MKLLLSLFLATTMLLVPGVIGAETVIEDFEDLVNDAEWTFGNPADVIETEGGNPGAWFHNPDLFVFAPILTTAYYAEVFTGDYREKGVTEITVDAITNHIDWGVWDGEMSILLRDTNGTPFNIEDDDYAYYVGPLAPLPGDGWVRYEFAIPSSSTEPVPDGWSGGWIGDLENFRPGVDWNDVITSVDRVEIWWLSPAMFAIYQGWDVGVDNISITMDDMVMPILDIKCNGLDDLVLVSEGESVVLDIDFQGNSLTGEPADFWVIIGTSSGVWSYSPPSNHGGWWRFPPLRPLYTGPMPESGALTVLNTPLPIGNYVAFFALDTVANGKPNMPPFDYDSVVFQVIPTSE